MMVKTFFKVVENINFNRANIYHIRLTNELSFLFILVFLTLVSDLHACTKC